MEILNGLLHGLSLASSWTNLAYCLAGTTLGTMIGVLPGVGPMASISMLLPLVFTINDPVSSMIFLAGIYYGTQYGGSTCAILLNLPGEASSVVTAADGYRLTQKGRAGAALAIAAISSFFAGTISTLLMAVVGPPLAGIALLFTSADYASLMLLGLLAAVVINQGSFIKGVGMVLVGMLLASIGTDINTGVPRFTFGYYQLVDGLSFVVLAMGLFGLAEILYDVLHNKSQSFTVPSFSDLYPTKKEFSRSLPAMTRGTAIGSILGLLPGAGAILSSFASYAVEKNILKARKQPLDGNIEAVAGPEAANNAGAQTSMVPMLALGIPTTAVMSLMLAALMINGIVPGPQVITNNSELFWGLIASLWIGNCMLLILNYPLIGVWVSLLRIPRVILYPMIVIGCTAGAFYINNNFFDVWMLIPFTVLGYVLKKLDCQPVPLIMGFVIGGMFEEHLRRSLSISQGDWTIFLSKPLSLTFLIIAVTIVAVGLFIKHRIQKHD